jgi:hypothetical protein
MSVEYRIAKAGKENCSFDIPYELNAVKIFMRLGIH